MPAATFAWHNPRVRRMLTIALLWITVTACERRDEAPVVPAPAPAAEPPAAPTAEPEAPLDPGAPVAPCGDAQRCHELALEAVRGGQGERAAELFGHACDGGLGQACFRLGEMLRDGRGIAPDEARANELFARGCRYGSPSACDALGH